MPPFLRAHKGYPSSTAASTWANIFLESLAQGPFSQHLDDYVPPPVMTSYDGLTHRRRMSSSEPPKSLYTSLQKYIIQVVSTATSSLTLLATIVTFYWFCKMQKRLRHKLIMLSILGCFIRGLFYFVFSIIAMGHMPIPTASNLCQVSGFFIQLGNEITDFSTLFIAIHGALQIFRPAIGESDTGDGLYPYRNYVFAATLIVPVVVSSLAFANPDFPYTAQGAFCGLPPSPPWWRLGLAWIPRYIIGLTVTGLAISVYTYVEWKFHAFSKASRRASTITITVDHPAGPNLLALDSNTSPESVQEDKERRPSVISLRLPKQPLQDPPVTGPPKIQSLKEVRSLLDNGPEPEIKELLPQGRKQFVCTVSSTFSRTSEKSSASVKQRTSNLQSGSADCSTSRSLPAIPATPADFTLPSSDSPLNSHESPNSVHRRQLRQQLRLIFIYPIVYIVLWIPPMVLNVFQFFPKYQLKLPSWLAIFATICFMLMGFVDCIVFLWREKPWRRGANPNSVLPKAVKRSSCFRWRKRDDDNNVEAARSTSFPSVLDTKGVDTAAGPGSIPRGSQDTLNPLSPRFLLSRPKFGTRSSSEARSKARELAYQRLALERGAQALEPRETIGSQLSAAGDAGDTGRNTSVGSSTVIKEWWDRKDSLFRKDSIYPSPVLEKEMEKD